MFGHIANVLNLTFFNTLRLFVKCVLSVIISQEGYFMAKKGDKRKIIGLTCEACKQRHYYTTKNTMNSPDKVELVKYCPVKRLQARQVETKKSLGRNEVKPRR
jgi:large subunit ribosomal protein L33